MCPPDIWRNWKSQEPRISLSSQITLQQVLQSEKAFYALLEKVYKLCLPVDISLELFDQLVLPVLLFGCEVWGFGNITQIEILYQKYIKILLGIADFTPNVMVYGETGTIPIMNHVKSRMENFMRLMNGEMSKLSLTVYRLMRKKCEVENDYNPKWYGI